MVPQQTSQRQYAAAVIGLGAQGIQCAQVLAQNPSVHTLYLANRTISVVPSISSTLRDVPPGRHSPKIYTVPYDDLSKIITKSDFTLVMVGDRIDPEKEPAVPDNVHDAERDRYVQAISLHDAIFSDVGMHPQKNYRLRSLWETLPLILRIAEQYAPHAAEVRGPIIIGSNPVDLLTYAFAAVSGLHTQTVGLNHPDTYRFRHPVIDKNLVELLKQSLPTGMTLEDATFPHNGICIGEHGYGVIPIVSTSQLDGKGIPLTYFGVRRKDVHAALVCYPRDEDTKRAAGIDVALALREVAETYFTGGERVELAIPATLRELLAKTPHADEARFRDHPLLDTIISLGWPVRSAGRGFTPDTLNCSTQELRKFVAVAERYHRLQGLFSEKFSIAPIDPAAVGEREALANIPAPTDVGATLRDLSERLDATGDHSRTLEMRLDAIQAQLALAREKSDQKPDATILEAFRLLINKLTPLEKLCAALWEKAAHVGTQINSTTDPATQYAQARAAYARYKETGDRDVLRETLARITSLAEAESNIPTYRNLRGRVFRHMGEQERAIADFRAALESEPTNAQYRNNLAIALHDANRTAEALECLYDTDTIDVENLLLAAQLERARNNLPRADALYERLTQLHPKMFAGWLGRISVVQQCGRRTDFATLHTIIAGAQGHLNGASPEEREMFIQLTEKNPAHSNP